MSYDIDIVTLGCSKNLVDSEVVMRRLESMGYTCRHDAGDPQGRIAVINTCGFIADAKEESINTILEFAQRRESGKLQRLYVMGCLSQRYREDLEKEIPVVDRYFGKFDFAGLYEELSGKKPETEGGYARRHITTGHYAYIKISEGCDRRCAYCAIPVMTGRQVSRPEAEILQEVRDLAAQGIAEFQIIAQELTAYGTDIDGRQHIAALISHMADIEGVRWIRLHYAYPASFPYPLLDVMREKKNVCRYIDIALQHISDNMLTRMHRHVTRAETIELIRRIRREVPGICIRTTLMVGFPGETEEDFDELMAFVREMRFERMGAFAYSEEEGTYSAVHYDDDVPEDVKHRRLDMLMRLQQDISMEMHTALIGQKMKVVVDRREGDYFIARTEYSSPEVDPEVLIPAAAPTRNGCAVRCGKFYEALITGAEEFDLYAEIVKDYE